MIQKHAFSLVELSIVLVILGLLTGGILAGQSLIRASELRSVNTEAQKYRTAIYSFRDRYFMLPGEMTNATSFWGKDNTNCPGHTGVAATPGTCNGDGSGLFGFSEGYRGWQQLAMAGLIEGTYAGTITSYLTPSVVGVDIPKSKMGSNAGWTIVTLSDLVTTNNELGYNDLANVYRNYLFFSETGSQWATGYPLKPEDAWNLDTKSDDGLPAFGKLRGGRTTSCGTSAASTSTYNLAVTTKNCFVGFVI